MSSSAMMYDKKNEAAAGPPIQAVFTVSDVSLHASCIMFTGQTHLTSFISFF